MSLPATVASLESGIESGLHSGGQLTVVREGREVAALAFGEARPGEPMTPDHLMLWLSVTKPVTAVAVARLWERGDLDLDAPVADTIPEFAAGGKEAVTTRHLLTHTGGIRALNLGFPEASWDEIVAKIASMRLEPRWIPGRKAGYHLSSSWFILGEIVRRIDGRALERYVREELFEPLGMDGCWIGMPEAEYSRLEARIAPVYDTGNSGESHPWTDRAHATRCSPGGGGLGPVRQLARFWTMLVSGGELDGRRFLSATTAAALTARHRVGLFDHTFRHQLDWGLGVIINSRWHGEPKTPYGFGRHASPRTFGHGGYRSALAFADPEARLVVACVVNGTPSDEAHRLRFEAIGEAVYEDLGLAVDAEE